MTAVEIDMDKYEFFQLQVYDIHGHSRGRLVSRSRMQSVLKHGMGMYPGICFVGDKGQLNAHPAFLKDMGFTAVQARPILSTLKPCQRAACGDHKVGSVLCELRCLDGSLVTCTPREITVDVLRQLDEEFGLTIHSIFEAEFGIRDTKTGTPFVQGNKWASTAVLQKGQSVLMGLLEAMQRIDVRVDTLMPEYAPGQFEVTFDIAEGIKTADTTTDFKLASSVFLKERGYNAEFMACVHPNSECTNGFHFNFSLWDSAGQNVFVDTRKETMLSEFGERFLAGMLEHAPAMAAFCSPTINCYRRIGRRFAPKFVNWACGDRSASFRLKTEPGENVYIENRLPSSACSPHLVMASTLAAGMDGVRRKLKLPEPLQEARKLPTSLEQALKALESDTVLRAALGSKFVDLYVYTKHTFECDEFKAFGELSDGELLVKEKEYYYDPM